MDLPPTQVMSSLVLLIRCNSLDRLSNISMVKIWKQWIVVTARIIKRHLNDIRMNASKLEVRHILWSPSRHTMSSRVKL